MKSSNRDVDLNFAALIVFTVLFCIVGVSRAMSAPSSPGVRVVKLNSQMVGKIRLKPGRSTVLHLPSRPSKVILGNPGAYAVEYVENDLAIAPLRAGSQSNLFVYVEGRRFAFDLYTVGDGADSIILVRDLLDQEPKPKAKR